MSARSTWSNGLRFLFHITVLKLVVGVFTLFFYLSDRGLDVGLVEFFCFSNFAMAFATVLAGSLDWRRSFCILLILESFVNSVVTFYLNRDSLLGEFGNIMARPLSLATYVSVDAWRLLWCTIVIGFNAVIAFYIWHYELHRDESQS